MDYLSNFVHHWNHLEVQEGDSYTNFQEARSESGDAMDLGMNQHISI